MQFLYVNLSYKDKQSSAWYHQLTLLVLRLHLISKNKPADGLEPDMLSACQWDGEAVVLILREL